MNISKYEQRVLHALAQGGRIVHRRDPETGKIVEVDCFNRPSTALHALRTGCLASGRLPHGS
ncbi:MAG TPA: YjhX family toxin [Allosphingosinicella sp.]